MELTPIVQTIDFRDILNIIVSRISTNIRLLPRMKYKLDHHKKLFCFIQFTSELANGNFLKLDVLIIMTTVSVSPVVQKKAPIIQTAPSAVVSNAMFAMGIILSVGEAKTISANNR